MFTSFSIYVIKFVYLKKKKEVINSKKSRFRNENLFVVHFIIQQWKQVILCYKFSPNVIRNKLEMFDTSNVT